MASLRSATKPACTGFTDPRATRYPVGDTVWAVRVGGLGGRRPFRRGFNRPRSWTTLDNARGIADGNRKLAIPQPWVARGGARGTTTHAARPDISVYRKPTFSSTVRSVACASGLTFAAPSAISASRRAGSSISAL